MSLQWLEGRVGKVAESDVGSPRTVVTELSGATETQQTQDKAELETSAVHSDRIAFGRRGLLLAASVQLLEPYVAMSTSRLLVAGVYLVTFALMACASMADPGMINIDLKQNPQRSYKSTQFPRPIRRYDHWCRWLGF